MTQEQTTATDTDCGRYFRTSWWLVTVTTMSLGPNSQTILRQSYNNY